MNMKVGRIAIWIITRYVLSEENDPLNVFFFVEFCSEVLFMQDCDYR